MVSSLESAKVPHVRLSRLDRLSTLLGVYPADLNPDAQELRGGAASGRWARPGIDEAGLTEEDVADILEGYERPKRRGDCLTSSQRYELQATRLSKFGLPIFDPDPIYDGDGKPDGSNCVRPCPFVSCKHHLALDVSRTGGIGVASGVPVENMSPLEGKELVSILTDSSKGQIRALVEQYGRGYLQPSCALDVADAADLERGTTLELVGRFLGVTRERVRQIESESLGRLRVSVSKEVENLEDFLVEGEDIETADFHYATGYSSPSAGAYV